MKQNNIIAGPCSAETREQTLDTARELCKLGYMNFRAGVWKPRTKPGGFEGNGEEALKWLKEAKEIYGIEPYVEVAKPEHVLLCKKYGIKNIWIGARTTADPFAVQELADTIKGNDFNVLVKNPVSPDVELWIGAIQRIQNAGISNIKAIHRGFTVYKEKYYRNAPLWGIPLELKRRMPDIELICDPSHISGNSEIIKEVMQKALDFGFDGFIVESHINPCEAWTDAKQQVTPDNLDSIVKSLEVKQSNSLDKESRMLLNSYRSTINILDEKIIFYLGERMKLCESIGRLKNNNNVSVVQMDRWGSLLENNIQLGEKEGLSKDFITKIWNTIHEESLNIQENI